MAQGSPKKFCPWCGAFLNAPGNFCSECGSAIEEPAGNLARESGDDEPFRPTLGVAIVWAVIAAVGVYAFFNWFDDEPQADTFVPSAGAPCHGWIDWDSRAPDVSQLFDIHWSLLEGEKLTRDEYREWLHLERDIREDLEDAGAVPYILTEHKKQALAWLEAMDWILVEFANGGNDVHQLDYGRMDYHADQMGIEWADAILACPPSERS